MPWLWALVFFAGRSGMAQGEETRKLMCECGKPLGTFTTRGLDLYCRHCKHTTTVPYGITSLQGAIAFVERLRRRFRP